MPEVPPPTPEAPAGHAVRYALADGLARLLSAHDDPPARPRNGYPHLRGPEVVHRMRVATRRLRSDLRTFGPLLQPGSTSSLVSELKWLGDVLGEVRESDVQLDRQRRDAAAEQAIKPDSAPASHAMPAHAAQPNTAPTVLDPLFAALEARRASARIALEAALSSPRFDALLDALVAAVRNPPLDPATAESPCVQALPRLALHAWKDLSRKARKLHPRSDPDDFHRSRIRAKRLRYAAEAIAPALPPETSKAASRMAGLATQLQDLLGEHQDAVNAEAAARAAAETHPGDPALADAARALARRHHRAARRARKAFPDLWRKIDRKKIRRWLQSA